MDDDAYKDMVIQHDKHIDTLATSIESLATGVGITNEKLESMIDVMSKQNVFEEKLSNMEKELKESFDRVHNRNRTLGTLFMWAIGLILAYTISFGVYLVQSIHSLETNYEAHATKFEERWKSMSGKVSKLDNYTNRNFGYLNSIRQDKERDR